MEKSGQLFRVYFIRGKKLLYTTDWTTGKRLQRAGNFDEKNTNVPRDDWMNHVPVTTILTTQSNALLFTLVTAKWSFCSQT